MKTITKKVKVLWAKLPKRAQSALRTLAVATLAAIALTVKPLLPTLWESLRVGDYETAKAIVKSAYIGVGAAVVRVAVPLLVIYGKALGAWLLKRITGTKP